MKWQAWLLTVQFVVGYLCTVFLIGKPRTAITSGTAAGSLIASGFSVWCVLSLAGVL